MRGHTIGTTSGDWASAQASSLEVRVKNLEARVEALEAKLKSSGSPR